MTSNRPLIGVVVLNFNGKDCLLRCLASLRALEYENFFVVVVDNASKDDSLDRAKEKFSEYTYVSNHENRGFASGMNIGMRLAFEKGAAWVWLFNNDAVADRYSLGYLIAIALTHERAGLLSPLISDAAGKIWFGKGQIDSFRMRTVHKSPKKQELESDSYPSEFLTGCALLVRRDVFRVIGDLDEHFFLYYEDADFSLRAREQGFEALVVPKARVMHTEQSQKNQKKIYHLVFSGLLFFRKHARFWQKPYFLLYGTIRRIKNLVDIRRGRGDALIVRRAYHDFYHGC